MSTLYFMLWCAVAFYLGVGTYYAYLGAWLGAFNEKLRTRCRQHGDAVTRPERAWLLGVLLFFAWPIVFVDAADRLFPFFFEEPPQ